MQIAKSIYQKGLKTILKIVCVIVLMILIPAISGEINPEKSWSYFHGPHGDNMSKETGLLKEWHEKGPELLWTAAGCGKGYSTVVIADKMIFTAGTFKDKTHVLAFDYKGDLKWKKPNGKRWKAGRAFWARNYDGSRATPTVNDGLVYHLSELGHLCALKVENGAKAWAINIAKRFDAKIPEYGYAASLLIDKDNLICYPGGSKGYIAALDKKTGKTVWANKEIKDPPAYSSPILIEAHGIRQIITMTGLGVIGVNADTGELLWRIKHRNKRKLNIANPVYYDGYVCISTGYGGGTVLIKLNYEGKKIKASKVWMNDHLDNHHGGIIYLDGYIYGTGHNKKGWLCLDFKTGETVFRDSKGGKGSFLYADGMFYYLTEKGIMNLVKPSSKSYKVVSRFKVPEEGKRLYWTHPVVFNGRLYIRYDDKLLAYKI